MLKMVIVAIVAWTLSASSQSVLFNRYPVELCSVAEYRTEKQEFHINTKCKNTDYPVKRVYVNGKKVWP